MSNYSYVFVDFVIYQHLAALAFGFDCLNFSCNLKLLLPWTLILFFLTQADQAL